MKERHPATGDLRDRRAEALKPEELRDQMTHESREEGRSKENSGEMDGRTTYMG